MIAKNIKGKSFKGCVNYVMNDTAELLEAEGVWADSAKDMIRSFAMQRSGRKEIKQPVGHIPISFAPEDKYRMTNEFMLQLAKEYMLEMGIKNTQYIIVRHHNTDNDHLHIVYNRIDNDLKLISVNHDYKRNIKTCKKLKDKHNLTYGKGKGNVKREKLDNPDKVKYYIHDAIKSAVTQCKSPAYLRFALQKFGITLEYKHKRATREIEGVSFRYDNIAFKGSQVDRRFSFGNLKKEFEQNILALQNSEQKEHIKEEKQPTNSTPKVKSNPKIGGIELRNEQLEKLKSGDYIYLQNVTNPQNGKPFSVYVVTDDQFQKAFFFNEPPDAFIKYGKYEMRLMDKKLIEKGFVTKAKVKWYGGGFAYPYLWKNDKLNEGYKESWRDPRETKSTKINTMEYELNTQKKNKRLKR